MKKKDSIDNEVFKENESSEKRIDKIRNLINKRAGSKVSFDIKVKNPSNVDEWIPTGSRWLDSIISKGEMAGIPVGRILEVAGLESSGKSFLALQIAKNALPKDFDIVLFDSESTLNTSFVEKMGIDTERFIYIQALSCEFVLETIEELLQNNSKRMIFIWDSLAMTPCKADVETDFNPQATMAAKPRVLSKGFSKIMIPLNNHKSTLLICNQLKTNITSNIAEKYINPYFTPGGKSPDFAYSLRIWLTAKKNKDSFIYNENGEKIGSEIKAKIKKSKFGTEGRECEFSLLWGDYNVSIQDEESWIDAIKKSKYFKQSGPWSSIIFENGNEEKFQLSQWKEKLKDENFKKRVLEIMDDLLIKNCFDIKPQKVDDIIE